MSLCHLRHGGALALCTPYPKDSIYCVIFCNKLLGELSASKRPLIMNSGGKLHYLFVHFCASKVRSFEGCGISKDSTSAKKTSQFQATQQSPTLLQSLDGVMLYRNRSGTSTQSLLRMRVGISQPSTPNIYTPHSREYYNQ